MIMFINNNFIMYKRIAILTFLDIPQSYLVSVASIMETGLVLHASPVTSTTVLPTVRVFVRVFLKQLLSELLEF